MRFVEHCSWEKAVPKFKDPDRVTGFFHCAPLVARCWTESQPALSFLSKTVARVAQWLECCSHSGRWTKQRSLSWLTPVLEVLCPMRR